MPRVREIREALQKIQDPVLGRSILDLGMVRNINSDGPAVSIEIAVIRADGVVHPTVQEAIVEAVKSFPGVERVDVSTAPMNDRERRNVAAVARRPETSGPRSPSATSHAAPSVRWL